MNLGEPVTRYELRVIEGRIAIYADRSDTPLAETDQVTVENGRMAWANGRDVSMVLIGDGPFTEGP